MQKLSLLLLVFLITTTAHSQTQVFKSYEDYQNRAGETFDEQWVKWGSSTFGQHVKFKSADGSVKQYQGKNMWGFIYKNHLFRVVGKEMAMLADSGRINFFINGSAGLGILSRDDGQGGTVWEDQTMFFVSTGGMNEKIYRMPMGKGAWKDYKELKREHPEHEDLYDCINVVGNILKTKASIEECVKEYNKGKRK